MIEYEEDTHFCLKCHGTVLGLENYVNHRKTDCGKTLVKQDTLPHSKEISLKADDFFSSLELRSSSKKPEQSTSGKNFSGILTRSKITAAIQATSGKDGQEQQSKSGKNVWIGGNQIKDLGSGDNQSKLITAVANLERRKEGTQSPPRIVYDDSDEDSEEYDYEDDESSEEDYAPPRNFTGGKWKPSSPVQWGSRTGEREWNVPPASFTGGKWKPKRPPSPSYTKGKWKPQEDDGQPHIGGKYPPPGHTKGKWRPVEDDPLHTGGKYPPPGHTRGKWRPGEDENSSSTGGKNPPPGYTKGKWRPGEYETQTPSGGKYPPPGHTKGKWRPVEDDMQPSTSGKVPPPSHTKGKWKPTENYSSLYPAEGGKSNSGNPKGKWKPSGDESQPISSKSGSPEPGHIKLKAAKTEVERLPPNSIKGKVKMKEKETLPNKTAVKGKIASKTQSARLKGKTQSSASKLVGAKRTTTKPVKSKSKTATAHVTNSSQYKLIENPSSRKCSDTLQYWCGPCNRKLASKIVYERHLKSELHFKRFKSEGEFDEGVLVKKIKLDPSNSESLLEPVVVKIEENEFLNQKPLSTKQILQPQTDKKKRNRRKVFETCIVCRSKVNKLLMGKHLISHYHCRKGNINSEESKQLVLENIFSVILESPFQCSVCKFYCNTHEQFLDHWKSQFHQQNDQNYSGYYFCAFCKHRTDKSIDMLQHLSSFEHLEVVSVINRSVPINIKKISEISCLSCKATFGLNIQLLNHCRKTGHDHSNVNIYNEDDYTCKECHKTFGKALSLQRHLRKKHSQGYFFCGICNLNFKSSWEAETHRRSMTHRYATLEKKLPEGGSLRRTCEYCKESFNNFLLLKEHLKCKHPEHKVRCPYCGKNFIISQELGNHLKNKSCKFPENESEDDPRKPHKCLQCCFSSDSLSELWFHVALHGEALITDSIEEEDHKKKMKSVAKYKCPVCEKFFSKYSLQAHLRFHTGERPFVCKTCNASFARKNNLLYHEKSHERKRSIARKESKDGKSFLCSTCGAGFNRKFTLQQHMLTHGGKLCRCPEVGCFFIARKMSELQEHFKTHSSEKNFACDLCSYKGKTKKQLKVHMTNHEDDNKRYGCSICFFTCKTAAHLRRHVRIHTGAKPFKCPYCAYNCNNMENLRRHILSTTKHPGKSVYECRFCKPAKNYHTNHAKEFRNHLIVHHEEEFGNGKDPTTYIAGIYEAQEDSTCLIDVDNLDDPPEANETIPTTKTEQKLNSNKDPVVTQLVQPSELASTDQTLDQMLPMFIIPKDDQVNVEIGAGADTWNLIGRYDVEESGALVPFQSGEDDELFEEHF